MRMSKFTVIILITLSVLLIVWQYFGMNKTMSVFPEMSEKAYIYNDYVNGGGSIGTLNISNGKLSLDCQTRRFNEVFPFCSVRIPLTDTLEPLDISGYSTLHIWLEMAADSRDTVLIYLHGDEGKNDLGEPETKAMLRTLDPGTGLKEHVLPLDRFLVPSWWMFAYPEKDSSTDLTKITDIQVSTGDAVHERREIITIWRMELHGKWIGQTELIILISLFWVLVALNAIRETGEMKTQFLANMSHEIRTPMNGILLALNLARSSKDADEANKLLDSAISSSNLMLGIINDILDISKLESGKLTFQRENWVPHKLITDTKALMAPVANEKGLDFVVENSLDDQATYLGDVTRVGQVVNNLVSNAIKFTEEGSVTLRAKIIEQEEGDALHIEVEDTGPGISAEDQVTLFDRFVQVDKEAHSLKGTGLGLAISKELVSLMGGQLQVESDGVSGSRFYFAIPVKHGKAQALKEPQEVDEVSTPSLHILLVEDLPLIQNLLSALLKKMGHTVSIASNGREAIDMTMAEGSEIELILMDNQMPVMSGIEATQKLRKLGADTPIIALTADAMDSAREAFEDAGVNGFVTKPISEELLVAEIAKVMGDERD